mmetsp:Transcript_22652/g.51070  ORF Transcript_22652/g.51070 Transcript_22652/m.51070 type:complete len:640 (+) Transcript_22652:53-1972(+)
MAWVNGLLQPCGEFCMGSSHQVAQTDPRPSDVQDDDAQAHLLKFEDELGLDQQAELNAQLDYLREDFEFYEEGLAEALDNEDMAEVFHRFDQPPELLWDLKSAPKVPLGASFTDASDPERLGFARRLTSWRRTGLQVIAEARVAVLLMAGGVDFEDYGPLPLLDIGLPSKKTLLQLLFERVKRVMHIALAYGRSMDAGFKQRGVKPISIYVICNEWNLRELNDFLEANELFGMRESEVHVLAHRFSALVDDKGKVLLERKHKAWVQPGGHGMCFQALVDDGLIPDLKSRGITHVFLAPTNNLGCKVLDPVFLGHCEDVKVTDRKTAGVKLVQKLSPDEEVGVLYNHQVTKKHGDKFIHILTPQILEKFETPQSGLKRKCPIGGDLFFNQLFRDAVTKVNHLKRHRVSHVDLDTGETTPAPAVEHPANALQLVHFVSDLFDACVKGVGFMSGREEMLVIRTLVGEKSVRSALSQYSKLCQTWIRAAGGSFEGDMIASDRELCEISPLVSYAGEGLQGQFREVTALPFLMQSSAETQRKKRGMPLPDGGLTPAVGYKPGFSTQRAEFFSFAEAASSKREFNNVKRTDEDAFVGLFARSSERISDSQRAELLAEAPGADAGIDVRTVTHKEVVELQLGTDYA